MRLRRNLRLLSKRLILGRRADLCNRRTVIRGRRRERIGGRRRLILRDDCLILRGDRPLIGVRDQVLYGVPWDGKEQCFRNVSFPLKAICEVQRADTVSVSEMSFDERRKLLMTQCFIPMWDTDTALIQMKNIAQLARTAEIVRVFCGTSAEDAVQLYELLKQLLDHA